MQNLNILLIEDNQTIARQLCEFFEGHKWSVDYADNGKLGKKLALEHDYDVIILDLNLPDLDGLQICRDIKNEADIIPPILMLTARDSFEDKANGFGEGADDYVTKPFDFRELTLRCQALARRQQLHKNQTLSVGELLIDQKQHKVTRQGQTIKLTNIGFKILTMLAQSYPQAVSRSQLIKKIWADDPPDSDALRSHMYSLRNALDKPFARPMLTTITNVGFKLEYIDADK